MEKDLMVLEIPIEVEVMGIASRFYGGKPDRLAHWNMGIFSDSSCRRVKVKRVLVKKRRMR
jgi:hypothetical protein